MLHSKINAINALEILDSRGLPTLQVSITTDQNKIGIASVPSGASTGEHEALELRDKDTKRYQGKGVLKAMEAIHKHLTPLLMDKNVFDQQMLDRLMCDSDGTENKSRYGANAILGCSLAIAKAAALTAGMPLYRYLGGPFVSLLPCPMMNLINGGVHADNGLDFQEFMIRPIGAATFSEAIQWGSEIFHTLKTLLKENGFSTAVGDEGGFAPAINSAEKALDFLMQAIEKAGFRPKEQISLALDCAASEFYDRKTKTYKGHTSKEQIALLTSLVNQYPIDSIEDGMAEDDWEGWKELTTKLGDRIQLVGDDLFVTNTQFLTKGLRLGIANSILIKVNQIGTLTETAECVKLAQVHGYTTIISHRSGETEDTSISDFAVAFASGQIKTGSLSRSERTAKYNRLLEIESELGCQALYRDSNRCRTLGRTLGK